MTSVCSVRSMNNLRPLDDCAIGNRCVLDDDNNAVTDNEAKILVITFLHVILVDHPDIASDSRVLINDSSLNDRVCSNTQGNLAALRRL